MSKYTQVQCFKTVLRSEYLTTWEENPKEMMVELILEALDREGERKGLGSLHLQRYKGMEEHSSLGNHQLFLWIWSEHRICGGM